MKCPSCHADNRADSRFCSQCATPLGKEAGAGPEAASLTKTLETPVVVVKQGTVIAGKYRIIDEVGAGGMGVVYKAEDLKLKRAVALKFLPPHLMDEPGFKERFLVEAQAAAALSHPNICVIHEVGESEDRPYIAMEYVEGETLRDRVRKGPLEPAEAVSLVDQVAAGLGEAHGKGIVHRDIKSANIMVTAKGRAKVMDFGLAKLRGGSSLTKSQTTVGTVAYMSPEQARGEGLDERTDIWSLGVVLYELLSGKLPFQGDHDQTLIYAILQKEPESLVKIRPSIAPELEHVVFQALTKKSADRYRTMEELREDLAAVAEGLKPLKAKPRAASIKLAVLPFINLTGDPEQEYLSDGLTQEMITLLGRLHPGSLGVIARTSVMRYKKTDTPIDQIGRELGVDYVLEGSARREGSRVRVSADLIQVRDQTQLWGDAFEREMSGILALQNDLAREMAKALALKLLPSEQALLAKARRVDQDAYEAYIKGMAHWYKLTPPDLETAKQYFESALKKDPDYALAHVGLALVWIGLQQFGLVRPDEAAPPMKAAAQKALELDDSLPEVHHTIALIRYGTDWDWEAANEAFIKAIDLNPNYALARVYYSQLLAVLGHSDEAVAQADKALKLDPLNSLVQGVCGNTYAFTRRYDEAIVQARGAIKTSPHDPVAHSILFEMFHSKGLYEDALPEAKAFFTGIGLSEIAEVMDRGYSQDGYHAAMRAVAETLAALSRETFVSPFFISMMYSFAGEKEQALNWMEKVYEIKDPNMPNIITPAFNILHDEPRYRDMLRRMNLPMPGTERRK